MRFDVDSALSWAEQGLSHGCTHGMTCEVALQLKEACAEIIELRNRVTDLEEFEDDFYDVYGYGPEYGRYE